MAMFTTRLITRIHVAVLSRLRSEEGQTSAEYALVLIGAGTIATLVLAWAKQTNRISSLLDSVMDAVVKRV